MHEEPPVADSSSPTISINRRRWLLILLGLLIAALIFYLLVGAIDWRATVQAFKLANSWWVLAALASIFVNGIAKSQRWRTLFPPTQPPPGRSETFGILMAGQVVNSVLLLRSGDIFRAYFAGRDRGASTASAFGTIGAEKLVDVILVGLAAALVLPLVVLPSWVNADGSQVGIVSLVATAGWVGLLLSLPIINRLLSRWGRRSALSARLAGILQRLLDGLTALREWRRLPVLLLWTAAVWGTAISTNLLLFQALDLPATLLNAVLVLIFIYGGVSIPVTPGQLGVFEAMTVLALSLVGVDPAIALAYALLLHGLVLLLPAVFGGLWLYKRSRSAGR